MDGIILINKEKDYTSHDIVAIVKKVLKEKVGHTGTLDPNATGVLPILIGKGTKISKYLINHDKIYKATLKLGIKTDTADITGKILESIEVNKEILNEQNVISALKNNIGKQEQYPPMYSAIKVHGKKLYEYARKGQAVAVEPRKIEIYDIELNDVDISKSEIIFTVKCSKGTYIRTLCEDIAKSMNTIGCMKELERLQVGNFKIEDSIKIDELKQKINNKQEIKEIIKIEDVLKQYKSIKIQDADMEKMLNGVKILTQEVDGIYRMYNKNFFIGTAIIENKLLKRDVIL